MINIKTAEDIEKMKKGGKILAEVIAEILKKAKPGVSELELEDLADKLIKKRGAFPGFKKVKNYSFATCISTNDVIVHGIPGKYRLKEGDVFGIDCGVYFDGFFTDMSNTVRIRSSSSKLKKDKIDKFLEAGQKALNEAINKAKTGNRIGHISRAIQDIVEKEGYSVVRELIGHGVGKKLHEDPEVPGFLVKDIGRTPLLEEGMTIAIEVIYNMGKKEITYAKDGWTIKTRDGSISGLFEHTVLITKKGPLVITS